jgi:CRP-like cAMP-binding protein
MAMLADTTRNATVRAATDVEVLAIHREDFTSLHGSIPALQHSIQETLKQRPSH